MNVVLVPATLPAFAPDLGQSMRPSPSNVPEGSWRFASQLFLEAFALVGASFGGSASRWRRTPAIWPAGPCPTTVGLGSADSAKMQKRVRHVPGPDKEMVK